MRKSSLRVAKVVSALALTCGLLSTANAQTFSLESTTGRPGESAQVRVFLEGGPSNTAALNYTVVVDGADLALLNGNMTGTSPLESANYSFDDNTPATGEYRAVLYANSSSAPTFSTQGRTHVGTIVVPIAAGATDGAVIDLSFRQFSQDNTTGLVGVSNSAGESIVPGGGNPSTTRPAVQGGTITINAFGFEQDFRGPSSTPSGWEFAQIIPAEPATGLTGTQTPATGFHIKLDADNTFGFLQRLNADQASSPDQGQVLVFTTTVGTTATTANDVPTFRTRATAADASFSQFAIWQETQPANTPPIVVPTAGNDKVFHTLVFTPQSVTNNVGNNGYDLAVDIVAFDINSLNGMIGVDNIVRRVEVTDFTPSTLGGESEVLNFDFSSGATNGFTGFPNVGGLPAPVFSDQGGLGVTANDGPGSGGFAFGFWENKSTGWSVQDGKVYRLDFGVKSTSTSRNEAPVGRLRVTAGATTDFAGGVVIGSDGDSSFSPDADGENYTGYFWFPNEVNGVAVDIAWDVYNTNAADNGGLILTNLRVRSYDAPSFLQ